MGRGRVSAGHLPLHIMPHDGLLLLTQPKNLLCMLCNSVHIFFRSLRNKKKMSPINSLTNAMSKLSMEERIKRRRKFPKKKSSRKQFLRSPKRRRSVKKRRRTSSHSFSSPVRFIDRRRDPRSRDRPYNKYTPKRSPGGRWKGKGENTSWL